MPWGLPAAGLSPTQAPETRSLRRHCAAYLGLARPGQQGLDAEAAFRDVLAARLRVVGADHPSTLTTRYAVASRWQRWVIMPPAEAEYRDVLAARRRCRAPTTRPR